MQRSLGLKAVALAATSLLGVGLLAGCSTTDGAGGGSGGSSNDTPGVSAKQITLGALLALTGTFASGAKAQLAGARLYWSQVNDDGGVCDGRSVKIVARDHGYDPQKAVTAYSDIRNNILGIQLLTGTPMTEAVAPQMEQDQVSSIPMSWSPDLLDKDSILIPGTTYDVDMINAVDYLVKEGKLKKGDSIGYIYFQGDFGGPGLKGATYAAKKHGITVNPYQVDPSVTSLSSQISQIAAKHSKAIFMSVSPPLLANAAAVSHTQGLDVPIVAPTPTFVPDLMKSSAAKQIDGRVLVVSPYNAWSADSSGVTKLRKAYKDQGTKSNPQQFFIAGYSAAKLMHSALKATCAKGDLTRASLKKEFAHITSFDLDGLSVNLSYKNRAVPPALSDYILKADKSAVGGLTPVQDEPFKGSDAKPLLKGK